MRSRASLLVLLSAVAVAACEPSREPVAEAPAAPLVIGTSPPGPVVLAPTAIAADEPAALSSPLAIPARDPRLSQGRRRARGVVVTEVQGLEALFAGATQATPDRPLLARSLAETYAELARVADGAVGAGARRSSRKYYELLSAEYPEAPQIDEAYYYAGLERELAGDAGGARRSYFELIKRHPSSTLVPFAYFGFGEMFFVEAAADPSKDQLAEQAYREVLKQPPAQNALYTEAQRRLAEIALRKKAPPFRRP